MFFAALVAAGFAAGLAPALIAPAAVFVLVAGIRAYLDWRRSHAERLVIDSQTVTIERLRKGRVVDTVQMPVESMCRPAARIGTPELVRASAKADGALQKQLRDQLNRTGVHLYTDDGERHIFAGDIVGAGRRAVMGAATDDGELEWLARKIEAYLRLVRGSHEPMGAGLPEAGAYTRFDSWIAQLETTVGHRHEVGDRLAADDDYGFLRPLAAGEKVERPEDTAIEIDARADAVSFELPRIWLRGDALRAAMSALFSNTLMLGVLGVLVVIGYGLLGPPWENVGLSWGLLSMVVALVAAFFGLTLDQARRAMHAVLGHEKLVLDGGGLTLECTIFGRRHIDFIPIDSLEGVDIVADVYMGSNSGNHKIYSYALLVYSFDAEPLRIAPGRSKDELVWLAAQIRDYIDDHTGASGVEYVLDFSKNMQAAAPEVVDVDDAEVGEVAEAEVSAADS